MVCIVHYLLLLPYPLQYVSRYHFVYFDCDYSNTMEETYVLVAVLWHLDYRYVGILHSSLLIMSELPKGKVRYSYSRKIFFFKSEICLL